MNKIKKYKDLSINLGIAFLFALSAYLRYCALPLSNVDTQAYISWYDILLRDGVSKTLGTNFSGYTPTFNYILAFATIFHGYLPKIVILKLTTTFFDIISTTLVYKIVRLKYPSNRMALFAAALFFIAPTVILNSSYWGQTDILYVSFLLASIYFILSARPFATMIMFGLSIAVKAQAVFLFPFFIILTFKKRIPWYYLGIIPAIYFLTVLPTFILGRPILSALSTYPQQFMTFHQASMNAPNLYIFLPLEWYGNVTVAGILFSIAILYIWIKIYSKRDFPLNLQNISLMALTSVALVPYVLPKMHERYFFSADVFSIIFAFYWPSMWWVAVLYQVISTLAYSAFLFHIPGTHIIPIATGINTLILGYLLWKQNTVLETKDETMSIPIQQNNSRD